MTTADHFIEVSALSKSYLVGARRLSVLHDLDLTVERGEMVAIVGASGVGKSTLLHVLGGLDKADGGRIRMDSIELGDLSDSDLVAFRNRHVGFVFQFHHLLPEFTALENVAMPLLIRRMKKEQANARAAKVLAEVGLGARLEHQPGELSGGERQRCAFARALVTEPACVLADEPTGNLDSHTADEVFDAMVRLSESHRTAFVIVTHDTDLAARAQRVYELRDGVLRSSTAST